MDKKKISSNKQKDQTMSSKNDLKLKITELFAKINPKNQGGFLKKMAEYDLYSKLDLSEESLILSSSQKGAGSPGYTPLSPSDPRYRPGYKPGSPEYTPYSPKYSTHDPSDPKYKPTSPGYAPLSPSDPRYVPYDPNRSPTYGPDSPYFRAHNTFKYSPPSSPDYAPPRSESGDSEGSLNLEELEAFQELADINKDFLQHELQAQENEFVETFAIPEGQTIYRRDEIVSELLDQFRDSETSAIFSNEDKLQLWVNDLLKLVDDVSTRDIEGNITGAKEISPDYKPVVDNFRSGQGTGVSWVVPVSKEKKKVYDAGNDGDYFYTVDRNEELKLEDKVVAADPKNTSPESKYRGYDNQERILYSLSKPSRNSDELLGGNDGSHVLDSEVYYIHDVEEGGKFQLGKRILDKGVYRVANIYENIGKKDGAKRAKAEAKKLYETLGRKRLVGTEEVEIAEPEKITTSGFVVTKPGGKKLKPTDGFYQSQTIDVPEQVKTIIDPFRSTGEKYVLISEQVCIKDPYQLENDSVREVVDPRSLSVSGLKEGDKVVIRTVLSKGKHISSRDNTVELPSEVDLLLSVSKYGYSIGQINEFGDYYYDNEETMDIEQGNESYCLLNATPVAGIMENNWYKDLNIYRHPRIISVLKNDISSLKEGDQVMLIFTDLLARRIINRESLEVSPAYNPYYCNKDINNVKEGKVSENLFSQAKIISISDDSVEVETTDGDITVGTKLQMSIDDFRLVYLSKNIKRAEEVIGKLLIHNEIFLRSGKERKFRNYTDALDKKYESVPKSLFWAKVVAEYGPESLRSREPNLLVQMIQPTLSDNVSEYVLIPKSKIQYELEKLVFERDRLTVDGTLTGWFKGIFNSTDVGRIIPTLQDFLHKISHKLRTKESIHYSFIQDISKLALDYEKYQITGTTKELINKWISWNLVKHVEELSHNYFRVRENYTALLKLYETTDELNPEKFRLNRQIKSSDLDYTGWNVDRSAKNYSGVTNAELVAEITKAFRENIDLWSSVNIAQLSKFQVEKLMERKVPFEKKWNQIITHRPQQKSKEESILEAIYGILDPILKNKLLLEFIDKDCFLGEDEKSGTSWYYSKLDTRRTKLVCPHVYLELTGKPLTAYSSEPLKDGTVVCKNCGQVLNSLVFSYFEGYEDGDKIRERVTIVNGREVVGTMDDTELMVEKKFIFSEEDSPDEYSLEVIMNEYISTLPVGLRQDIDKNRETKADAIKDCLFYIIQYNITDYNAWYAKNKDALLAAISKITKVQSKIDEIVRTKYAQYVSSRKNNIVLARLAILIEKEVIPQLRQYNEETIDQVLKAVETRRLEKGEKPTNIENTRKEVIKDFNNFTGSTIFPNISDLYAREASAYEQEELKAQYEDKFKTYTSSDINDSLSLFDALRWMRYYIRTTHKDQKVMGVITGDSECVPGTAEYKSYGTDSEQSRTIERLEEFVADRMPAEENRTGVKSRKQFYSSIVITDPVLDQGGANTLEAKLIIKNLYGIPTTESAMKAMYDDKAVLEVKKAELKGHMAAVIANLSKYRLIDYLVTYKRDSITGKVDTRIYENGIDSELGVSREQLIAKYLAMTTAELTTEANRLRNSEIELEVVKKVAVETCTVKPKQDYVLDSLIGKISEKLAATLGSADKTVKMLVELEKDLTATRGGVKSKMSLYKEYERLTKMLNYLKRDYNYLANNANLRERKAKLAAQLDIKFKEGDTLEGFDTEYDYIMKYLEAEYYSELKSKISPLNAKDIELIEILDCGKVDELEALESRNIRNKFLFCANILRILLQFTYNWAEFNPDSFKKAESFSNLDIQLEDDSDLTALLDKKTAEFIVEFIENVYKLFRREEQTFIGIEDYKERNYEIVKQVERVKRMKHIDDIGSDLLREFNKVMKGKRVLDVGTKEVSSDNALETAKVVEQEHYEENPNGVGNYGTVFTNDLEGDHDDVNEEEAYDMLD
jgi:hypothetical protein